MRKTVQENKKFIYLTTNKVNGKIYIGQHCGSRSSYYFGSGFIFLRALKKYGKNNFERKILCYCENQEQLNEQEAAYIKKFNSTNISIGYNIRPGGNVASPSEETKIKYSIARKKYFENPENVKKMTTEKKKFFKTKRGKELIAEQSKKKKETCSNLEWRKNQSEKLKLFFKNPDARKNMSEKTKKYQSTESARQANRENKLKYLQTEKGKKDACAFKETMYKYHNDPENKIRMKKKRDLFWSDKKARDNHSKIIKAAIAGKTHHAARAVLKINPETKEVIERYDTIELAGKVNLVTGGAIKQRIRLKTITSENHSFVFEEGFASHLKVFA